MLCGGQTNMTLLTDLTDTDLQASGEKAAWDIWNKVDGVSRIVDPRLAPYAAGVMSGFAAAAASTGALLREVIDNAGASAEGLNIDVFQGIVEVLQNADDLGARDVRIALVGEIGAQQLLIVHDGAPVTCHHVLPMVLPFLTTKANDADQKGRFGIGLKTLGRVADTVSVHSAPYHFMAAGLNISTVSPALAIPGFYEPGMDTMLRLDLVADFSRADLETWFEDWHEDGLLFLRSVRRFAWRDLTTGTESAKIVAPGDWATLPVQGDALTGLDWRRVVGMTGAWTIYRATVRTTPDIPRAHKATGESTAISFALAGHDHPTGIFVGFRTRVPVSAPFSIDAQFDPSTAREGLIDNAWNRWLIARCSDGLLEIAKHLLDTAPDKAWPWIATPNEIVGTSTERWPREVFAESFGKVRAALSSDGTLRIDTKIAPISKLVFEDRTMEGLLDADDLLLLRPERIALPSPPRDAARRWREVLAAIEGPSCLDVSALAEGFTASVFDEKLIDWWVEAGARLTRHLPDAELFSLPCWRSDQGTAIACAKKGSQSPPMVIHEQLSSFARRWSLMERLSDAYAGSEAGESVIKWLLTQAESTSLADAVVDLKAFAQRFANDPQEVDDEDLRSIRDRFDLLTDRAAQPLGPAVGRALKLDAFSYKGKQRHEAKASPCDAYLPKSLEGENAFWPVAAGDLPGLKWLAPSYDDRLKTGTSRGARKRADGTISRGPRKFLLLLGAATAPRIVRTARVDGGQGLRRSELQANRADHVAHDYSCPDLDRVIGSLERASKKDRKERGPALFKTLSRHWDSYASYLTAPARRTARVYIYDANTVTAGWLARLKETRWVVVGGGELSLPADAVIRSQSTAALYAAQHFVVGVTPEDVKPSFAAALKPITDVRASDLVELLERYRSSRDPNDGPKTLAVYRSLAKLCPGQVGWNTPVGDLSLNDLRFKFRVGQLVWTSDAEGGDGRWRSPTELFVGRDIFHDPTRFVPGGSSCADLWRVLGVPRPSIDDCLSSLRTLATKPYTAAVEAVLIEVYRYLEPMIAGAERRHRDRMRTLPVGVDGGWGTGRPVYHMQDRELRARLSETYPDLKFWNPPCDTQTLVAVSGALGLTLINPALRTREDAVAAERGEALAARFEACVDHLSNELMRNDPVTRDRMRISWDDLRRLRLQVHDHPFDVSVREPLLSAKPLTVRMGAVLHLDPPRLDIWNDALAVRDSGGRAIASLFPRDAQHRIEAEWVASWMASCHASVERIRNASDALHQKELADRAEAISLTAKSKIKVTAPLSRAAPKVAPRRLKPEHSGTATVIVRVGNPVPAAAPATSRPLVSFPPPPSPSTTIPMVSEPIEYSAADLEQRGWEIVQGLLNNSTEGALVDFRKRHGVGADGVINWKTFVELKATARSPHTSVEISSTQFERAQKEGLNFMLALVSGLEEGHQTQVRLILDPTRRTAVRPLSAIRLGGLLEADAVIVSWHDDEEQVSAV